MLGQREAGRDAGIGGQHPGTARVREHGDAASRGEHGRSEDSRGVEQLLERLHDEHSGRFQEGRHSARGRRERAGVRGRGARALARAARGEDHDGLLLHGPAREPRERLGIVEALEVEEHGTGLGILGPVREELQLAEVALVAQRRCRGDADAAAEGVAEGQETERRALRAERHVPPARRTRRAREEPHLGLRVDGAEAVGPQEPHAHLVSAPHEGLLQNPSLGPGLRVARGHEHGGAGTRPGGIVESEWQLRGRQADHRELCGEALRVAEARNSGPGQGPGLGCTATREPLKPLAARPTRRRVPTLSWLRLAP
jgi:hypothetical protein